MTSRFRYRVHAADSPGQGKETDILWLSARRSDFSGTMARSCLGFVNIDDARSPTLLLESTVLEALMGPFRRQKSVVTVIDPEGPGDRHEGTSPTMPPKPLVADNTAVPAAWYPDPVDSTSFRDWDGVAWTRLTKAVPPPAPVAVGEALDAQSEEGAVSVHPDVPLPETPAAADSDQGAPTASEAVAEHDDPAVYWVTQASNAVSTAWVVGTPDVWRSAAKAAVVVAEIAQTMRVTSYARQKAEQLAQAAEEAALRAQSAQQAAGDAIRMAERTAQDAEEAARAAQNAVEVAINARQKADQMAQAAPMAVESAQLAAQTAAKAKAAANHIDQIVIKARETNTSEAWTEALQIAADACGEGDRPHIASPAPEE